MQNPENSDIIKFGRTLNRQTPINESTGVIIVVPNRETGTAAAQKLWKSFSAFTDKVTILIDPEADALINADAPVVVIGNLADSKCVRFLYHKFLCLTDKHYPGNGGYTVRTIVNPFGTGMNLIHIGYSDDAGLSLATAYFLDKIGNPIPYCNEVVFTRLPCSMKYCEKIASSAVAEDAALIPSINASFWWYIGYIAYLTNDSEQLHKYLDGWRKVIEISRKNHAIIGGAHLHMTSHIEIWRLMEYTGMIPDDLRGDIETCLYNWAQSEEGMKYAIESCSPYLPSHNHTMFCALSLTYMADFFKTHYPDLSEPSEWTQAAENVFYTFNNGGWKPFCDDSGYAPNISLPLVCMYSIFEDKHRFLQKSGKMAAQWIKSILGQNGFMPSFGDGTVYDPFPGALLAILSHYLDDGELKYIHDNVPDERNLLPGICMQGAFDSGVEPVKPTQNMDVTVVPLDKFIYDSWDKDKKLAESLTITPPYGAYEQCFDKVSIRTGWGENEDYLLIDGLGSNGIHSYSDTMGVLDYTSHGITWLVEENCYRWPEPENCCIVTIARNGFAGKIPGIALIEEKKILDDRTVYLRMRLKNDNHTDWIREVFFVKGLCVVFRDTVEALEDGEYVVCSHFKTPGHATLEGNTLKSVRKNSEGQTYEMRLSGFGSTEITMTADEIPFGEISFACGGSHKKNFYNHGIKMPELGREMWVKRYHENSMILTASTTRSSAGLKKGESISLTHVVQPATLGSAEVAIEEKRGSLSLVCGNEVFEFPTEIFPLHKENNTESFEYPHLSIKKVTDFSYPITGLFPIEGKQYACTLSDGSLVLMNGGTIRWKKDLQATIHCLTYAKHNDGMLLIGCGDDKLLAMNMEGTKLWEARIEGLPSIFVSWEKPHPQVVAVKCETIGGKPVIVAGCGDDRIRTYDLFGNFLNAFYVYATIPDAIEFADINADGELEILAAGKEASSQGVFMVYDANGKEGNHLYTSGWLNNIKSYSLRSQNGKFMLTCGMKYAENLKIMEIENGQLKTLSAKMLGGTVNTICEGENAIYAGTSKGFIIVLAKNGDTRWYLDVKNPVLKLFCTENNITALCSDGQILSISDAGEIRKTGNFPIPPSCWIQLESNILAGCGKSLSLCNPE